MIIMISFTSVSSIAIEFTMFNFAIWFPVNLYIKENEIKIACHKVYSLMFNLDTRGWSLDILVYYIVVMCYSLIA